MSLQRIKQSIGNQKTFKHLNAYIHLPEDVTTIGATDRVDPGATRECDQTNLVIDILRCARISDKFPRQRANCHQGQYLHFRTTNNLRLKSFERVHKSL